MIVKRQTPKRIEVDLNGPQGNAFFLIGLANKLARKLDYSKDEKSKLLTDMQSGDYDNLLDVFEDNFGDFVILYK